MSRYCNSDIEQHSQIGGKVHAFVLEVSIVEVNDGKAVLLELSVILDILENDRLVELADEFSKEEVLHLRCHKFPLERLFLNVFPYVEIAV